MGVGLEDTVMMKVDDLVCTVTKIAPWHVSHLKAMELLRGALRNFDLQMHWHLKHRLVCPQCGATADKKGSGFSGKEGRLMYFEHKKHWICTGCGSVYPEDYFDKKEVHDLEKLKSGEI